MAACVWDGRDCFADASECYHDVTGSDYRGKVSRTKSGFYCQPWVAQFPHAHRHTPAVFPDAGLRGHNFCRNPDGGKEGPWCYTTDPNVPWEYCNVGEAGGWACSPCETAGEVRGLVAELASACDGGGVCTADCCHAAVAASRCASERTQREDFLSLRTRTAFRMLRANCTSCDAFRAFFDHAAHGLGHRNDRRPERHGNMTATGGALAIAAVTVAFIVMLGLLCFIAFHSGGKPHAQDRDRQAAADVEVAAVVE